MSLRQNVLQELARALAQGLTEAVMCNAFVARIIGNSGGSVSGLDLTGTFLPFNPIIPVDYTFSLSNTYGPIGFPAFTPGDVVVFYSMFSGDSISHVMIAQDANTLVGTNNGSTFEGGSVALQRIDVRAVPLTRGVVCVRALSPEELVNYQSKV